MPTLARLPSSLWAGGITITAALDPWIREHCSVTVSPLYLPIHMLPFFPPLHIVTFSHVPNATIVPKEVMQVLGDLLQGQAVCHLFYREKEQLATRRKGLPVLGAVS